MLEWFIVAIVTFHNTSETRFEQMEKSFATKELCQQFYQTNMGVRDDVIVMYPHQRGHTLVCMTNKQIQDMIKPLGLGV